MRRTSTQSGEAARSRSSVSPHASRTPGPKAVEHHVCVSRQRQRGLRAVRRAEVERDALLLRFAPKNPPYPVGPSSTGAPIQRAQSPRPGCSTFHTLAPRSASNMLQYGPEEARQVEDPHAFERIRAEPQSALSERARGRSGASWRDPCRRRRSCPSCKACIGFTEPDTITSVVRRHRDR